MTEPAVRLGDPLAAFLMGLIYGTLVAFALGFILGWWIG